MSFFWCQVEVLNPDETPAERVAVVVDPGAVRGFTAANGMARLTINTGGNDQQLRITVSTNVWGHLPVHVSPLSFLLN